MQFEKYIWDYIAFNGSNTLFRNSFEKTLFIMAAEMMCKIVEQAGGINIDNVGIKFKTLLESKISYKFWIDMESDVRTDDWFDTDKVWQVLEECDKVLRDVEGFSMKTTEPPKHEHTFKIEGYLKTLCYDDQISERRYVIKEAIASQLRFLQNKAILDAKLRLGGKDIWYFEINEIK